MKLRRNCKDVTRLVLESEERPLGWVEQLSLRLHWMACENCSRFRAQAQLMRGAMGRWRRYRNDSE